MWRCGRGIRVDRDDSASILRSTSRRTIRILPGQPRPFTSFVRPPMNKNQRTHQRIFMNRRQFLSASAAAAAVTIVPRHVLGGANDSQKFVPPSEKVNIGIIGAGGQGRTNARNLFNEDQAQVIAIADPCESWDLEPFYYKGKAGRGPVAEEVNKKYQETKPDFKCDTYEDFRVMLEKNKDIDAVLIATPDHN